MDSPAVDGPSGVPEACPPGPTLNLLVALVIMSESDLSLLEVCVFLAFLTPMIRYSRSTSARLLLFSGGTP
jgi:hypothetical protein